MKARVEYLPRKPLSGASPPETDPLILPVLVLNHIFQPVRITSARRAIRLIYTGTAQALDDDGEFYTWSDWMGLPVRDGIDDLLPIVNGALRVPRIVHLRRYARCRRDPRPRHTSTCST